MTLNYTEANLFGGTRLKLLLSGSGFFPLSVFKDHVYVRLRTAEKFRVFTVSGELSNHFMLRFPPFFFLFMAMNSLFQS